MLMAGWPHAAGLFRKAVCIPLGPHPHPAWGVAGRTGCLKAGQALHSPLQLTDFSVASAASIIMQTLCVICLRCDVNVWDGM